LPFDERILADTQAESTDKSCLAHVGGQAVEALCPELTDDGGHLNERGQELVATAFLNFIRSLTAKPVARWADCPETSTLPIGGIAGLKSDWPKIVQFFQAIFSRPFL
jgi:hypothetical protein